MAKEKLYGLISDLHETLEHTEGTNAEIQARVRQFEKDLENQLEYGKDVSVQDQLNMLEAEFANEHPTAERILREIIDTLGRMGI